MSTTVATEVELCPLNDCTSMINNAENIMNSGHVKHVKSKSITLSLHQQSNKSNIHIKNSNNNAKTHSSKSSTSTERKKLTRNELLKSVIQTPKKSSSKKINDEHQIKALHISVQQQNELHERSRERLKEATPEQENVKDISNAEEQEHKSVSVEYQSQREDCLEEKHEEKKEVDMNADNKNSDVINVGVDEDENVNNAQETNALLETAMKLMITTTTTKTTIAPTQPATLMMSQKPELTINLSCTPDATHRNKMMQNSTFSAQSEQHITETPCQDGSHNPYSPSLLQDEYACVAESSFYSCYSDSAETQRETDSCSSPGGWHYRFSDSTPMASQNITPTTTRAATVSSLQPSSLTRYIERCSDDNKSPHHVYVPTSLPESFSSFRPNTEYDTPTFVSHLESAFMQCNDRHTEAKHEHDHEHEHELHNEKVEVNTRVIDTQPYSRLNLQTEEWKMEDKGKQIIGEIAAQEQAANTYLTKENMTQEYEPKMSVSANSGCSLTDLVTPYRNSQIEHSWELLNEERVLQNTQGVSRRLMWPSPLSPLSPSPSPTKTYTSKTSPHYTQINTALSPSREYSTCNNVNNIINNNSNANIVKMMKCNNVHIDNSSTFTTASKSTSRQSMASHEPLLSSRSCHSTTRVVKTVVQCGVDRSSGRPIPLRREKRNA